VVNVCPYRHTGNGSTTEFEQSSQLLPGTSVVPGTIAAPVEVVRVYPGTHGDGDGVGVGVGVGVGIGVGVIPGEIVGDGVGVGAGPNGEPTRT
jgi:hypothetical protein